MTAQGTGNNGALLSVQDLNVSYGSIRAVKGISFDVYEGEIVTLIGANGAGKSSTLRAISGVIPYKGTITFRGQDLHKVPADQIVARGIAQVPEGRGIFGNLTVMENLKLATWQRKDKPEVAKDYERVFGIFPRLKERRDQLGGPDAHLVFVLDDDHAHAAPRFYGVNNLVAKPNASA